MSEQSPLSHLSFSGAERFRECPLRWKSQYVDGVADPSGEAAEIGKMAHKVLEVLGTLPPSMRTGDVARHVAARVWGGSPVALRREAIGHVLRALRLDEVVDGETLAVEMELRVTLGGVPFLGYLDRADREYDGTVSVWDIKTGRRPGKPEWMDGKRRQISLYSAGFEALYDEPVSEGRIVWTAAPVVDRFSINEGVLAESVEWLRDTWDGIGAALQTGEFVPNPGALCSWCPMVASCPEGQSAVLARSEDWTKSIGEHGSAWMKSLESNGGA